MARPPQWTPENADRFKDLSIAGAYHLRRPYPPELFVQLASLITDPCLPILDLGSGTGEIARPLASRAGRVDAVDASPAMINQGKSLAGGNHRGIVWIESRAEDFRSDDLYGLITAGDSLHWMDWDLVLPLCARLLAPNGFFAIVHRTELPTPWHEDLGTLIAQYSTARFYETFDLIAELEHRKLFEVVGRYETDPTDGRQSIDDYIESFHSRSSLSRENMTLDAADSFDQRLRELVTSWSTEGQLQLLTVGEIIWGRPLVGPGSQ